MECVIGISRSEPGYRTLISLSLTKSSISFISFLRFKSMLLLKHYFLLDRYPGDLLNIDSEYLMVWSIQYIHVYPNER